MWAAAKMNCVTVVILKTDLEPVLEVVAQTGVLHPVEALEVDDWAKGLAPAGGQQLVQEFEERRSRLQRLIGDLPRGSGAAACPGPDPALRPADLASTDAALIEMEAKLGPLIATRARIEGRLGELRRTLAQLGMLAPAGLPVMPLLRSSYLAMAIGRIPEQQFEKLRCLLAAVPSVVFPFGGVPGETHVACVVLRKDKDMLDQALAKVSFEELAVPKNLKAVSAEAKAAVSQEVDAAEAKLAAAAEELEEARREAAPDLVQALRRVEAAILLLRIRRFCRVTEKTCAFTGWVPEEQTDGLITAITETTQGKAIVEVAGADVLDKVRDGELNVPVLFHRPGILKPFAMLVEGFAIPTYGMIDPTVFVALTFLFMFGMMFGDVGHGLVVIGLGFLMAKKAPALRDAAKLMIYCGSASVVFGFLYGSVFGFEEWLPALWTKPLEGINSLFTVALSFGIGVLSLGIVLNVVNALRAHVFWETFFESSGPLIGVAYWAGTGFAVKFLMTSGQVQHAGVFLVLIGAPLLAFVLKGPLLKLLGKSERAFPEGLATYVMEQSVEVMEIFMGYLANTVSFIRVAAFGLAHAGLFVAVFSLADTVAAHPGGTLLSWLVLLAGNLLIIVLEGVVVTIQALRLEYYEFFGKFFKGAGSRYEPVGYSGFSWARQTER